MLGGVIALDRRRRSASTRSSSRIALGLVLQVVGLVAIITLMHEVRAGSGWAAARQSIATVPDVVRGAVRLIRASSLLTALVVAELLWGFGMIAFEMFLPPRLAEVSGGVEEATGCSARRSPRRGCCRRSAPRARPWLVRRFGSRGRRLHACGRAGRHRGRHGPGRRAGRPDRRLPRQLLGPRRHGARALRDGPPRRRGKPPRHGRVGQLAHVPGGRRRSAASSSAPSPTPPASPPPCSSPASSSPPPARCTWSAARPPAPPAPPSSRPSTSPSPSRTSSRLRVAAEVTRRCEPCRPAGDGVPARPRFVARHATRACVPAAVRTRVGGAGGEGS